MVLDSDRSAWRIRPLVISTGSDGLDQCSSRQDWHHLIDGIVADTMNEGTVWQLVE